MGKLWHKKTELNKEIEKFTVGDDYILDKQIVSADCAASIAHARMLFKIGILKEKEYKDLKGELINILKDNEKHRFDITIEDEDSHTAIENRLTRVLGEEGKKIHTGRSRNDQVIAALRLFSRDFLINFEKNCLSLSETLINFAEENKSIPMPGRTHMQLAMPSSVGLWAGSFAEEIIDDTLLAVQAYELNNMSPLGSAASYGVPLPLDREMVSELLGFKRVQNNVLYVNNSRGKIESVILNAVEQVMLTLSKMAQDMILFSMPEFGYFTLPEEICTGSSIMPQKRNPGMLELIRAKTATVSSLNMQVKSIIRGLPSGYNRDFQETKRAFIEGIRTAVMSVRIMELTIAKLKVNKKALIEGFKPEIFATDRAIELVRKGIPFREAYREVGLNLNKLENIDPYSTIAEKNYSGTTGNLKLDTALQRLLETRKEIDREEARIRSKLKSLTGLNIEFFKL